MFVCTICGLKKSELGSKPEFEFRRRRLPSEETQLEGMSDWCTECEALRFFFKLDVEKKDLFQQPEGQEPEKKVANRAVEASIKCWTSRERPTKERKDVGTQLRTCVRKLQEIKNGLPSELPHGCLWQRKLRSASEDRSRQRERGNPAIERRSRSAVNESPREKAKVAKKQAEDYVRQVKDIAKLGAPKPDKHVKLDFPIKEQRKDLEELADDDEDADDSQPDSSPRARIKLPFDKRQLEELLKPLRKDVQQRVKQLVDEEAPKKTKKKTKHASEDSQSEKSSRKQRHSGGVSERVSKTMPRGQMSKMLQQIQEEERKQELKTKLKEKRHQVFEWKRIRRRVDDEYARVKTELGDLKIQAELKADQEKRDKDKNKKEKKERMRGGAIILTLKSNNEEFTKDSKEKTIGVALDEKIEHMLDALQEKEATKEKEEEMPETAETAVSELDEDVDNVPRQSSCVLPKISSTRPKRVLSKLNILLSTVQRARFRGFAEDPQELLKRLDGPMPPREPNDPPLPQFQTMPCARQDLVNLLHVKRDALLPSQIRPLKICRSPIYCPDCDCRRMFFISDFNEHLTHEHPSLAMERIVPCQAKTFFMDINVTLLNRAKCNMVYFLKDKFVDNVTVNHPDLIPILVMSARLRLQELFNPDFEPASELRPYKTSGPDTEIFLIWLTSLCPDDTKIIGTISIWPTSSNPLVEHLLVHTTEVYNIRSSQKLKNIYSSNRIVVLSGNLVGRMTNGGKNLLAVQVLIH